MSELTLVDLGLTSKQTSTLPAEHAQMLAATLDVAFDPTLALPLLWHWSYFNHVVGTAGLGPDGHPRLSGAVVVCRVTGRLRAPGRPSVPPPGLRSRPGRPPASGAHRSGEDGPAREAAAACNEATPAPTPRSPVAVCVNPIPSRSRIATNSSTK